MIRSVKKVTLVGLFFMAFLFRSLVALAGGDIVGNGGGLSENNILYAFLHMKPMLESCVYTKGCGLTYPERDLLEKIYQNFDDELAGPGVRFASSKEQPDLFEVDDNGVTRTAVTGDSVGSPIYFNLERLYPIVNGEPQYVDVLTAVGFLVHELGHHHGVKDHTYLDRLGGKVRDFLGSQRWLSTDLKKFKNNQFTVSAFFPAMLYEVNDLYISKSRMHVSVSNGYQIFDLSPFFATPSRCKGDPSDIRASGTDLSWSPFAAFDNVTQTQTIKFQISISWDCNSWKTERKVFSQTLEVSNQFKVQTLNRIDLYTWKLVDPIFSPSNWRTEKGVILEPLGEWKVVETNCEKIDYGLNPIGPCDF